MEEKETKVKDGNYIVIQSFMIKDLKLKGNELLVYAIIHGFSQDGSSYFRGSLQYLADWTNSTKQGIMKVLKSLIDKGLLQKLETGMQVKGYRTIKQSLPVNKVDQSTKFNGTMKQSLTDYETKFNGTMKQSLPNNIDNNIDDIIVNKDNIVSSLEKENISEELKKKLKEYIDYRKEIKKPIKTYRTIKTMLNKLYKDFISEDHLIESIDNSIANAWQGVFPSELKKQVSRTNEPQETFVDRWLRENEEKEKKEQLLKGFGD